MTSDIQQTPFVKQLAANGIAEYPPLVKTRAEKMADRPTRDKAVAGLRTYLSGRRQLSELEWLKLWKGLFFCMWMSDRARTQQRLAVDLAGLVDVLPGQNVIPFLHAFWTTTAREWNGIDVLRMDKFLHLVRTYLAASFRHLRSADWAADVARAHATLLSSIPLSPTEVKTPDGLRYHVIDIFVTELDHVDTPRSGKAPLEILLRPLRELAAKSPTKSVRSRAKEALDDEKLQRWDGPRDSGDAESVVDSPVATGDVAADAEWHGLDS
ncbi:MAG: hypothetical protein M1838_003115 [Thelocarpon superellum]|nr:MAG: hypothetical protein M1838_003115 [Thelocarpon superellum]